MRVHTSGEVPKWSNGADCKSVGISLRRFKSSPPHHYIHCGHLRQIAPLKTCAKSQRLLCILAWSLFYYSMTDSLSIFDTTREDGGIDVAVDTYSTLIVEKKIVLISGGITLTSGEHVVPLVIAYETYGTLSPEKDNVILIVHALTGDSHCAGKYSHEDKKAGWWDPLIGPGKAFDTNKYFIVCSNNIGGCCGTTGPSSNNPEDGRPYGISFPVITIRDIVNVQKKLLDYLGISKLLCVSGGSMGGMNTLEWAVAYPDMVSAIIPVSTSSKLSPQGIAFSEVERQAIIRDPKWRHGAYPFDDQPVNGLAVARMIGHITYLSAESMQAKFGRRRQPDTHVERFGKKFEIESYLHYQGEKFVERFDANSYIYLTKAMDFYDLSDGFGSLEESVKRIMAKCLFIAFRSDWLFSPRETAELVDALRATQRDVEYHEIESAYGHDAFLLEYPKYTYLIARFIERVYRFYHT